MAVYDKLSVLSRKTLNELAKDPSSFVIVVKSPYEIVLEPRHFHDIKSSIFAVVREDIGKFSKRLNGIILGFQNVMLLTQYGRLYDSSPNCYHCIQAEFFVFRAVVGNVLKGTVNLKARVAGHLGCLVHQTFNVIIPIPKPVNDDAWLGDSVLLGDKILFEITEMLFFDGLPYIKGDLRFEMEDYVMCPFNHGHVLLKKNLQRHIIKCQENYPDFVACPYNFMHRFATKQELKEHVPECPSRMTVQSDWVAPKVTAMQPSANEHLRKFHFESEDWDAECSKKKKT